MTTITISLRDETIKNLKKEDNYSGLIERLCSDYFEKSKQSIEILRVKRKEAVQKYEKEIQDLDRAIDMKLNQQQQEELNNNESIDRRREAALNSFRKKGIIPTDEQLKEEMDSIERVLKRMRNGV